MGAATGDLDPTFSEDGWAETLPLGDEYLTEPAEDVALQKDGKIVVVGTASHCCNGHWAIAVVRYTRDGALDATFGNGGWVVTDLGLTFGHSVAIQSDGKIVVAGEGPCFCFFLVRYNPNGSLDPDFGRGGMAEGHFREGGAAWDIALQKDGKIVAAGWTYRGSDGQDEAYFAVARFTHDGKLDRSFSDDGKNLVGFGYGNDLAYAVAIQRDGKIVLAGEGSRNIGATGEDFALARFNANGRLDRTFSGDGRQTTNFGRARYDAAWGLSITWDGRILVAGDSANSYRFEEEKIAVARYNPNGSPDRTFSADGKLLTRVGPYGGWAETVIPYGKGKVLVAGRTYVDEARDSADWTLVRYRYDGSRDSSFGRDGVVTSDFGTGADNSASLLLQGDRKIVAAGSIYNHFGVARYLP